MKNITGFAVLVIIFCAFVPQVPSWAGDQGKKRDYVFSVRPQFGMVYGQSLEIVYPTDTKAEYLSELRWDMKPLFYWGGQIEIAPADPLRRIGFFSFFSCKFGIPGNTGKMEDRDWKSTENDGLTNFSSHANETGEFRWLEWAAGISLPVKSRFFLKVFADISYTRFSFSGVGGHAQYAREKGGGGYFPIDDSPDTFAFSGTVITYVQEWLMVSPGVSAAVPLGAHFSFELFFQISPFIFGNALDDHLYPRPAMPNGIQFRDFVRWGLFLEPRGRLAFAANTHLAFSLEAACRYVTGAKGGSYWRPRGSGGGYISGQNQSGMGLLLLDTALLVQIRF